MRINQEKELVLNGQTFKIRKFTPETGCYWAFRLLGTMATLQGDDFAEKIQSFMLMDKKEFKTFQRDCLSHVFVSMGEAGTHTLMNDEGFLILPDLPTPDVFQLTLHAFMFTVADFFDKALIQSIMQAVQGVFQKIGAEASSSSPSA